MDQYDGASKISNRDCSAAYQSELQILQATLNQSLKLVFRTYGSINVPF